LVDGTAFRNIKTMAKRFTYRELTLLLGIVVALLVAFTFWLREPTVQSAKPTSEVSTIQKVSNALDAKKKFIASYINDFSVLFSNRSNPY
jgi:hypothetical protein